MEPRALLRLATNLGSRSVQNAIPSRRTRSGRNWCADTKESSRAERLQQLLMKTSRQLRLKPSFQASPNRILKIWSSTSGFEEKFRPTLKPAKVSFAFKTVAAKNTSDPTDVGSCGNSGNKAAQDRQEKGKVQEGQERGKGQSQGQNPSPNEEVVWWCCGKKDHPSTECWSHQKRISLALEVANTRDAKGKPRIGASKRAFSLGQGDQAAAVEQ